MTTCADRIAMLAEAETALHKLSIGKGVQSFGHGENHQSYNAADSAKLEAYVRKLQMQVDACNGVRSSHRFLHTMPTDGSGRFGRR